MSRPVGLSVIAVFAVGFACARGPESAPADGNAGLDSLNARLTQAYRSSDPKVYATLFTDTATFEWPAFSTVRGRAGLEAMAKANWATLRDMDLEVTVASRRVTADHATEFGAFQQSWSDSGGRMVEYGRYVNLLARQTDGSWLIDRFFGFEDSVRRVNGARPTPGGTKRP